MLTLAIDPGGTTGYALVNDDGSVRACGNWRPEDLDLGLDGLIRAVNRQGHALEAVVEKLAQVRPAGKLGDTLQYVVKTTNKVLALYDLTVHVITPTEWKSSASARLEIGIDQWDGELLTQHQKDAIRIGRYWIAQGKRASRRARWRDDD